MHAISSNRLVYTDNRNDNLDIYLLEFQFVSDAEDPPEEQITNILEFFDESIENGTLEGRGSGWPAKFRLYIMREMLVIAGELINHDRNNAACFTLKRAYMRCDGDSLPLPDFVAGGAVSELADMIQALRTSLGCE